MKIEITTNHAASRYGQPVCLVDGALVDDKDGLKACLKILGWTHAKLAEKSGKSLPSIRAYSAGQLPLPANVWNVLRDALDGLSC